MYDRNTYLEIDAFLTIMIIKLSLSGSSISAFLSLIITAKGITVAIQKCKNACRYRNHTNKNAKLIKKATLHLCQLLRCCCAERNM